MAERVVGIRFGFGAPSPTSARWLALVATAVGALVLTACAPAAPPAPTPAPPTTAPAAKPTTAPAAPTAAPAPTSPPAPTAAPAAKPTEATKPPAAPAAPAAQASPAVADEARVLASARQEGRVIIAGPQPESYRPALQKFTAKYPGIRLELSGGYSDSYLPKISAERKASQYLWDVWVGNCGSSFREMIPAGMLDPLKPTLFPAVYADSSWVGGFDAGWQDKGKTYCYAFEGTVKPAVWVNRDIAPEADLSKLDQLLDPKWKGKIAMEDPRGGGGVASGDTGHLLTLKGKDFLTKLFQQDLVLTSDRRQLAEWLVRGTYPIGIGLTPVELAPFTEQGLGKNLKGLEMDGAGARMGSGWGGVALFNKAPDPNATSLFINWLLSQEGQAAWVQASGQANSRRVDVPGPEASKPSPSSRYTDDEANSSGQDQAVALAKELLK